MVGSRRRPFLGGRVGRVGAVSALVGACSIHLTASIVVFAFVYHSYLERAKFSYYNPLY